MHIDIGIRILFSLSLSQRKYLLTFFSEESNMLSYSCSLTRLRQTISHQSHLIIRKETRQKRSSLTNHSDNGEGELPSTLICSVVDDTIVLSILLFPVCFFVTTVTIFKLYRLPLSSAKIFSVPGILKMK